MGAVLGRDRLLRSQPDCMYERTQPRERRQSVLPAPMLRIMQDMWMGPALLDECTFQTWRRGDPPAGLPRAWRRRGVLEHQQ